MSRRIAVVGGGIAGLTTAWQVKQCGGEVVLFEASGRVGGTVETVRRDGFTVELGPDGWVTEKPWAAELAAELGLETTASLDAGRVTYLYSGGSLKAMPDGMRMMVPTDLGALEGSELFSDAARAGYAAEIGRAEELRVGAPVVDESVASFVERHFGGEVLEKLAAPLLSGVFGGDVGTLSVRAVMPAFVAMEREYGSLIVGLVQRTQRERARGGVGSIFTSLVGGTQGLVDGMAVGFTGGELRLRTPVTGVAQVGGRWRVSTSGGAEEFDELVLATPAHATRGLLGRVSGRLVELLEMQATSAVIAAFGFAEWFEVPRGFGFLVPAGEDCELLAGTFVDQKFAKRVPEGHRLVRGFFGGADGLRVAGMADGEIAALALKELRGVLGVVPEPLFSVVRRWPRSLPQYGVGHLERMVELEGILGGVAGLHLVGNAYRGVGLPDLVRGGAGVGTAVGAGALVGTNPTITTR